MQDLKDVTNNVHYENYRSRKLAAVTYNGVDNNKNKGQLTKYVPSTLYIHIIDFSCSVYHLSIPFPTLPCDIMFQAFHIILFSISQSCTILSPIVACVSLLS